ncbi:MAG TPA: NAD-dependent epimerase/dehydratase family protein [Roseimicrobium sp.]|nr:NAD-dependent epimerase/dehydratase family protein [Roseimicrobium sp.]
MSNKIAILGANGFVGSRLIEMMHLEAGGDTLRPVVRSFTSLARLARFDLDWRIADACDTGAMTKAFEGCDSVVNLIVADPDIIVRSATASYEAAMAAGVKRMVFMSSASVHGQAPAPGTDESSPLHTGHVFAYNNAKVRAERALTALRAKNPVELVILRPSIVFGPRSRWITDIADQLLAGTAALLEGEPGICNSIYVDNLIGAIRLALTVPGADRGVYLVGDDERVTWEEFHGRIAAALGLDMAEVVRIGAPQFHHGGLRETLGGLKASRPVQAVLPLFPKRLKESVKAGIRSLRAPEPASPWALPGKTSPPLSEEMCVLQSCRVQLPFTRAKAELGYVPTLSFDEGMRRSIGWLEFAGYPVRINPKNL